MKRILVALAAALTSSTASAAVILYDGFDYVAGSNLVGQTNPSSGNNWVTTTSPAQSAQHKITAGNVAVPGLSAVGGSLVIPPTPNGTISRIALPLQSGETAYTASSVTGPSVYFSLALKLGSAAPTTGADYFFAGFHWNGDTGGMSVATGYAAQLHLRPSPTSGGTGADQEYELGISKNNGSGFSIAWADGVKFKADSDTIFVVGQYQFVGAPNSNTGDDIARLWVGSSPASLSAASPAAVSTTGPDVFASSLGAIRSFYFRSDSTVSGTLAIDELRVGTSFADVAPVPEPCAISLLLACFGPWRLCSRKVMRHTSGH